MRAISSIAGWTLGVVVLATASCAPATPKPVDPTAGPDELSGPPRPFQEMGEQEQKNYMMTTVVPVMQHRFHAFDDDYYANFGCPTCHGAEPEARGFQMPEAALPRLPQPETPEWDEMMDDPSGLVLFMRDEVVPIMAALLGQAPFDPATGEGFGCFDCHTAR
jgi:hypothetical protein